MLVILARIGSHSVQVNMLEAKNLLAELVRAVQAGEEVVIANRGKPVVRLVLAQEPAAPPARQGSATAILGWLRDRPLPPQSRRTAEEIDAAIEDERNAWD